MTRKLAAILVADMVGYGLLMAADEAGTLARLKAVRAELAKSTTTLKLLSEEERMRAAESNPVKHFFTRLLTI